MTDAETRMRLAQGEDTRTQFKSAPIGVAKLAAELTAFANAEGGVIFFGVNDDGTVVGLNAAQKKILNDELSNAANDNVRPSVYPRTEYHTLDGRIILAVIVSEGISKPYSDKSGNFWTKSGPDKRRITSREELQRLLQASLLIHADELPVPKTSVADIDPYHLGEFFEANYNIPAVDFLTPGKVDVPQKLQNLGFADGTQLTLAGLLLFGKNPQRYAPVNVVKAVAYVGNDMAGTQYRDSEDFGGTLRDMYKSTMQFLSRNLHHVQAGQGFNSLGKLEIPEVALQELVVNMFLHRDYFVSSPWRVLIFDDRVELISPGCLPNHLDIEKMKAGVSVARNPLIFNFATKELPYRGLGTGIKRALQTNVKVDFVSDRELNVFKAIVYRVDDQVDDKQLVVDDKSGEVKGNAKEGRVKGEVKSRVKGRVKSRVKGRVKSEVKNRVKSEVKGLVGNMSASCQAVYREICNDSTITYVGLTEKLGFATATIAKAISTLISNGLIVREGGRKNGHWVIIIRALGSGTPSPDNHLPMDAVEKARKGKKHLRGRK